MRFEWDETKNVSNARKHGIDFGFAQFVFADEYRTEEIDDVIAYGEERWKLVGRIEGRFFAVIYTMRGSNYRIISARRATRHEQQNYLQQNSA